AQGVGRLRLGGEDVLGFAISGGGGRRPVEGDGLHQGEIAQQFVDAFAGAAGNQALVCRESDVGALFGELPSHSGTSVDGAFKSVRGGCSSIQYEADRQPLFPGELANPELGRAGRRLPVDKSSAIAY